MFESNAAPWQNITYPTGLAAPLREGARGQLWIAYVARSAIAREDEANQSLMVAYHQSTITVELIAALLNVAARYDERFAASMQSLS